MDKNPFGDSSIERTVFRHGRAITVDSLPALPDGQTTLGANQRPTVDVTGAKEALVVGPDDVLIINIPPHSDQMMIKALRDALIECGLADRFVLIQAYNMTFTRVARRSDDQKDSWNQA